MRGLLIVAGALLWCGQVAAGVYTAPADSVRAKKEIKKMEFSNVAGKESKAIRETKPTTSGNGAVAEKKSSDTAGIVTEADTQAVESTPEQTAAEEKKSQADELKEMAKRDIKSSAKKPVEPTVSFPYYPGGNIAIREFVRKNQQYPPECKRERLRGRVEVMIAIAPDGTPHSPTISKSSGNVHMDAEALRIAELMPKWQPAAESDDPQGIDYVIFVNFRPGR